MINSMTGYGREEVASESHKILFEIKSVNNRYADFNIKIPRHLLFLEDKIRKELQKDIKRGKVDVFLVVENYEEQEKEIVLNEALLKSYLDALYKLRDEYSLKDDISVMGVSRYNDIFRSERKGVDEEAVWNLILPVLESAKNKFLEMRKREGKNLEADFLKRADNVKQMVDKIKSLAPKTVSDYQTSLEERVRELLGDRTVDEGRLITEVAVFADRVSVTEEIVRLKSHLEQFVKMLSEEEAVGRKLDFLIQEMNREINTIGSKCNDLEISKIVVLAKSEIEKIREQVQNVE